MTIPKRLGFRAIVRCMIVLGVFLGPVRSALALPEPPYKFKNIVVKYNFEWVASNGTARLFCAAALEEGTIYDQEYKLKHQSWFWDSRLGDQWHSKAIHYLSGDLGLPAWLEKLKSVSPKVVESAGSAQTLWVSIVDYSSGTPVEIPVYGVGNKRVVNAHPEAYKFAQFVNEYLCGPY